uniref:(northern house mosquito) hypothetical protein n=1 Tax=Culex pipiens TaxID=7175 RepID=A0A8D8B199_CULPI
MTPSPPREGKHVDTVVACGGAGPKQLDTSLQPDERRTAVGRELSLRGRGHYGFCRGAAAGRELSRGVHVLPVQGVKSVEAVVAQQHCGHPHQQQTGPRGQLRTDRRSVW